MGVRLCFGERVCIKLRLRRHKECIKLIDVAFCILKCWPKYKFVIVYVCDKATLQQQNWMRKWSTWILILICANSRQTAFNACGYSWSAKEKPKKRCFGKIIAQKVLFHLLRWLLWHKEANILTKLNMKISKIEHNKKYAFVTIYNKSL